MKATKIKVYSSHEWGKLWPQLAHFRDTFSLKADCLKKPQQTNENCGVLCPLHLIYSPHEYIFFPWMGTRAQLAKIGPTRSHLSKFFDKFLKYRTPAGMEFESGAPSMPTWPTLGIHFSKGYGNFGDVFGEPMGPTRGPPSPLLGHFLPEFTGTFLMFSAHQWAHLAHFTDTFP